MAENKTDYLALAKQHTLSDNTELLLSIAYSLIDLAESARRETTLAAAINFSGVALDGLRQTNQYLQQRLEELEKELHDQAATNHAE